MHQSVLFFHVILLQVMEFEIASAAVRIGAKVNEIYFNIPSANPESPHTSEEEPLNTTQSLNKSPQDTPQIVRVQSKRDSKMNTRIVDEDTPGLASIKSNFYNWNAFIRGECV